jgi:acetamidase/formamidase
VTAVTKRITREHALEYEMVVKEPALRVEPGETFVVETEDALNGDITREDQLPTPEVLGEKFLTVEGNPCAGPIIVEGAEAGDVLVVSIDDIVVADQGVMCVFENDGPLGDSATYPECRGPFTKIIRHEPGPSGTTSDGTAIYDDQHSWPLEPHIGTIGVAPLRPVAAGSDTVVGQGRNGGNFDVRDVKKGNRVLLPVTVDGAYLYMGDVHAAMGEGELTGAADESAAELTITCTLLKDQKIPWPRVDTDTSIIQINCGRPLESAIHQAFRWMIDWLVTDYGYTPRDAYTHMSVNPGVGIRVYQMVASDRLNYTVGVVFPKASL